MPSPSSQRRTRFPRLLQARHPRHPRSCSHSGRLRRLAMGASPKVRRGGGEGCAARPSSAPRSCSRGSSPRPRVGYIYISREIPTFDSVNDYHPFVATKVVAADGSVIGQFYRERRTVVTMDKIPQLLVRGGDQRRGQGLLQAPGFNSLALVRAAIVDATHGPQAPGRVHHHAAGGEELLPQPGQALEAKAEGNPPLGAPGAQPLQGRHPLPLPEPDQFRQGALRRRGSLALLLQQARRGRRPGRGGHPRRACRRTRRASIRGAIPSARRSGRSTCSTACSRTTSSRARTTIARWRSPSSCRRRRPRRRARGTWTRCGGSWSRSSGTPRSTPPG